MVYWCLGTISRAFPHGGLHAGAFFVFYYFYFSSCLQVIVKTTTEYQLQKKQKKKLYMPSIKKLNINLYDEVSEKVKVSHSVLSPGFKGKHSCLFSGYNTGLSETALLESRDSISDTNTETLSNTTLFITSYVIDNNLSEK